MTQAYVLTGQLSDSRSLMLDEPVPLAAGPVQVTVQAMAGKKTRRPHDEVLAEIHARLKASGHVPPSPEDVARRIAEERDSWE